LPRFSQLGTWTITFVLLRDRVDNTASFETAQLLSLGFPTTFQNADLSGQPDADNDGVPDANDNCPDNANANQQDRDLDGIGDVCDPNPDEPPQTTTETTLVVNSIQASSGITVDVKAGDPCSDGIDALRAEKLRSQTVSVINEQLVITATKPGIGDRGGRASLALKSKVDGTAIPNPARARA
jgi:hypothetical protein